MEAAWVLWYMVVTISAQGNESLMPQKQPMPSFEVCAYTAQKLFELEVPGELRFDNVMCVDENALREELEP
ncbi:MAG: hypothetical protein KAJ55_13155 [Anaerolineales bacterium]|nr:hypothetical protein [Anaerolineales bacterium]